MRIIKHAFLKTDAPMRYTLGVVYAPDEVDSQGDFAEAEEIEKACHGFMLHIQGRLTKGALGINHKEWPDDLGDIVECYCAPVDMQIDDNLITKGTWLLGAVWSESMFQKIEANEITGYSMGGTGQRKEVREGTVFTKALDEAMGARETNFQKALRITLEGR